MDWRHQGFKVLYVCPFICLSVRLYYAQKTPIRPFYLGPDFLKASSFAQSKCSDWQFCAETSVKIVIEKHETRKLCQIVTKKLIVFASFSCFAFISTKLEQLLKYFAQSCRLEVPPTPLTPPMSGVNFFLGGEGYDRLTILIPMEFNILRSSWLLIPC